MAYAEKYILSFISERGNDYKISILQQGYSGSAVSKKLGVAPVLSIESSEGRIQGSSLAFSIQSDIDGELRELYTTNNKEFKVLLYRNGVLYWQGYLLPELYSENYVYPPYDVAVTATDQLATLKDVVYIGEDAQTSLLDIIKNILSHTQINIQCKVHMNLNDSNGISVLRGSYISAVTYNGQSCYDALNAILLSCNCSIMQMGNTWLITSFTDHSYSYDLEGSEVLETHATIGQMYQADVWPSGSLNMVNAPALKGAKVDYNHTLRNSFLKNADITSRESWMYTPDLKDDGRFPGVLEASDGKQYKCFFWLLYQKNISSDSSLQLWQDVRLSQDPGQVYSISLKYLFSIAADLLLLSVTYYGDNGQTYRLTGEGWITNFSNSSLSSYIQVTGKQQNVPYIWDVADMSKYETATVQFELPATSGNIRIGFINSTADYAAPTNRPSSINITQVYFSVSSVTGQTATTEVEKMATSAQEELELGYGDKASTVNGDQLVLNTLRDAGGAAKSVWYLSGREFTSYYMAMLQEYSRYYGSKKMQLQGVVMGKDAFRPFYVDTFSGMVMRMLSGQYNLLDDEVSISLEEVVTAYVDYDTVVYATDNKPQQNISSSASAVVSGGGATTLGGLLNVDDNVDEVDTEAQVIVKDGDSKVWIKKAISEINFNEKKLSDYLATNIYLKKDTADGLYTPISSFNALNTKVNDFLEGSDTDAIINKWKELEAFLAGQTETSTLAELLAVKANQSALDAHIANYNNFKNTTNDRLVALESLWAIDEENNALYPRNSRGIWSYDFITAGGKANSGSSSGGLIQAVYDYNNLGGNFNNNNLTDTFNAYAINSIYNEVQKLKESAGGAFNEAALWNTLATVDATKVIDSSHIPDLSSKYLPLSGGTMANNAGISWSYNVHSWDAPVDGLECISTLNDTLGYYAGLSYKGFYGLQMRAYGGNTDLVQVRGFNHANWGTWRDIIHSGNIGDYALPKSGGTITGGYGALEVNRATNYDSVIKYTNSNGLLGYIGIGSDLIPYYSPDGDSTRVYTLIHSGNIGQQNVDSANVLSYTYAATSINYAAGESKLRLISEVSNQATNNGYPGQYWGGLSAISGYVGWQLISYGNPASFPNPRYRAISDAGVWSDWKAIAFTDSNVASATKLQTARAIWGQSFDGTESIWGRIEMHSPDSWNHVTFIIPSTNGITINTFESGVAYKNIMLQPDGGNVLIGTTIDIGNNLFVKGVTACINESADISITPATYSLIVGNAKSAMGYNSGIAFCGLHGYGNFTDTRFRNHAHAWIGLGKYINSSGAEMYPLVFATNGNTTAGTAPIEIMRITPSGNVGIGTTNPQYKLDVNGTLNAGVTTVLSLTSSGDISADGKLITAGFGGTVRAGEGAFYDLKPIANQTSGLYAGSIGTSTMRWANTYLAAVDISGNVRMKPTNTDYGSYLYFGDGSCCYIAELSDDALTIKADSGLNIKANVDVYGNIYSESEMTAGAIGSSSDKRLKNDIELLEPERAISLIMALKPSTWKWNCNSKLVGKRSYGLIAQEVAPYLPEAVMNNKNYLSLVYDQFHAFEIAVLQNHETRLEIVERENREMKCEIKRLNKELNQYRRT